MTARRFISGAVCPSCQAVDRTIIEAVAPETLAAEPNEPTVEIVQRRCVACGFSEALDPEKPAVTAPLPRARYEKSRQTTTEVQAVKIIDLGASKPS